MYASSDCSVHDILQNAAFAIVLHDHQNSFRSTISSITSPICLVLCFFEIALFLELTLEIALLPHLFPIFHLA